jgi:hypothetical protein
MSYQVTQDKPAFQQHTPQTADQVVPIHVRALTISRTRFAGLPSKNVIQNLSR